MTLLYKEMRLVAHPTSIVFAFLGCLVLVPLTLEEIMLRTERSEWDDDITV